MCSAVPLLTWHLLVLPLQPIRPSLVRNLKEII
jgi:hypothetical protein